MKTTKTVIGAAVMAIAGFLFSPAQSYAHETNSWHGMTQAQRNNALINRAYQEVNTKGGQCKEWIQKMVYAASGNHVWLPVNNPSPNDWYWVSDQPRWHPTGMSTMLEWITPGYIIQMRLDGGIPHTAIVASKDSMGLTLIDSNWFIQSAPEIVKIHYITYTALYEKLEQPYSFSVYYIN